MCSWQCNEVSLYLTTYRVCYPFFFWYIWYLGCYMRSMQTQRILLENITHSDSVARTRLIVLLCWLISSSSFFAFFSLNGHASVASAAVSFLFFFDPCWPCVCEASGGNSNSSAVIDLSQPLIGPSLPARLSSIFDSVLALRKDCKFLNERVKLVHEYTRIYEYCFFEFD